MAVEKQEEEFSNSVLILVIEVNVISQVQSAQYRVQNHFCVSNRVSRWKWQSKMVSFLSHSLPLFFLFSSSFVLPFCSSYRLASLFAELETVSLQNLKNASSLKSKTAELGCLAIHSAARMRSLLVVDRRPGMS